MFCSRTLPITYPTSQGTAYHHKWIVLSEISTYPKLSSPMKVFKTVFVLNGIISPLYLLKQIYLAPTFSYNTTGTTKSRTHLKTEVLASTCFCFGLKINMNQKRNYEQHWIMWNKNIVLRIARDKVFISEYNVDWHYLYFCWIPIYLKSKRRCANTAYTDLLR